jgi:hypothetical protein
MEEDPGFFLGLGIEYDAYDWFVATEITSIETKDSWVDQDITYYITAGMQFGKFTPSITCEVKETEDFEKFPELAALPAELQPPVIGTIGLIQNLSFDDNEIITLGLRYNMDTNVALKAKISKYSDNLDEGNDATLVRVGVNSVL